MMREDRKSPARSMSRALVIILLTLVVLTITVPALSRPWLRRGDVGLSRETVTLDGVVWKVQRGSAAERAGIKSGDFIDESQTPFAERYSLPSVRTPPRLGQQVTFRIVHDGQAHAVSLTAQVAAYSPFDQIIILTNFFVLTFGCVVIGAALVLLRPTRMTWGLFFYCLGLAAFPFRFWSFLPNVWFLPLSTFIEIIGAAGAFGFLIFGLSFGRDQLTGWRLLVYRISPYLFVAVAGLIATSFVLSGVYLMPTEWMHRLGLGILAVAFVGGILSLFETYAASHGEERERLKWVVAGLAVGVSAYELGRLLYFFPMPIKASISISFGLQIFNVLVPLTVAYAIIRHRVLDINFVISRALVYGALTSLLVAIFALLDWFLGRTLAGTNFTLPAEIGAAVALGFWLNALHSRVDKFIDTLFFRRRHLAEVRLARVADALPHATTPEAVEGLLVREPVDALELASAALFRLQSDGAYHRSAAIGWLPGSVQALDADDALVLHLKAAHSPLDIEMISWPRSDVPVGPSRPVLALPIVVRRQLVAIALYGAHASGVDLDPDEVRAISGLAVGAAAAYDHIEAESLRRANEALRRELDERSRETPALEY